MLAGKRRQVVGKLQKMQVAGLQMTMNFVPLSSLLPRVKSAKQNEKYYCLIAFAVCSIQIGT